MARLSQLPAASRRGSFSIAYMASFQDYRHPHPFDQALHILVLAIPLTRCSFLTSDVRQWQVRLPSAAQTQVQGQVLVNHRDIKGSPISLVKMGKSLQRARKQASRPLDMVTPLHYLGYIGIVTVQRTPSILKDHQCLLLIRGLGLHYLLVM